MPDGSVWNRRGSVSLGSKPTTKVEIPNGRTPPDWVYFCCTPAMYLVMYSTVVGSSTVRRCDWHSTRALSIRIRPSAVRPGVSYVDEAVHLAKMEANLSVSLAGVCICRSCSVASNAGSKANVTANPTRRAMCYSALGPFEMSAESLLMAEPWPSLPRPNHFLPVHSASIQSTHQRKQCRCGRQA